MGDLVRLDPYATRCPVGSQVIHARWGVCTVLEAYGAWRRLEVHLSQIDESAPDDDPWGGERTVAAVREAPVWSLLDLEPYADAFGTNAAGATATVYVLPLRQARHDGL